jgi:hypothetical protein
LDKAKTAYAPAVHAGSVNISADVVIEVWQTSTYRHTTALADVWDMPLLGTMLVYPVVFRVVASSPKSLPTVGKARRMIAEQMARSVRDQFAADDEDDDEQPAPDDSDMEVSEDDDDDDVLDEDGSSPFGGGEDDDEDDTDTPGDDDEVDVDEADDDAADGAPVYMNNAAASVATVGRGGRRAAHEKAARRF